MNTWKVILATMVIFGTGVVTGGLLVQHSERLRAPHHNLPAGVARPFPNISAGGTRLDFLRRMERELNLTPDQRERVDKLLKESQDRSRKIMEPVAPQMREELQQTKQAFRELLTTEQQARFDELLKQQQRPKEKARPVPLRDRPADAPEPK